MFVSGRSHLAKSGRAAGEEKKIKVMVIRLRHNIFVLFIYFTYTIDYHIYI